MQNEKQPPEVKRNPLGENAKVKPFATLDIETDPFSYGRLPVPFAAAFYVAPDLEATELRGRVGELLTWWGDDCIQSLVTRCKKWRGIIYAHNGGKFDFHFLLDKLPLQDSESLCIGSRIVQLKFPAGYEFRDSYALIPLPLSSWGKKEIDIQKLSRNRREKHKEEIVEYLKADVRYLHEMLAAFFAKYGQKLTLASTTFSILQKKFGYKIPHFEESDDGRFRKHYFAGRVEFYRLGRQTGPFTILDINSAFPWAMTGEHWLGMKYERTQGKPTKRFEQSFLIVECNGGGSLALRAADGSVYFPKVGIHRFHTTGWEVKAGLKAGAIKKLKYIWAFTPRRVSAFTDFVEYFYRMKADAKAAGNKADEYHAKLFLNSCYGKFGLSISKYRDVAFCDYYTPPEGKHWEESWHDEERGISVYQRPSKLGPRGRFATYYCIATAASITGRVRAFLFESMRRCKGVLYCDTDSIIARSVKGLKQGPKLGEWKNEMECDVVWIGGKKLYVAHNKEYPWKRSLPKGAKKREWIFIQGLGWNPLPTKTIKSFKTAAKGVKLTLRQLIDVCEGKTREGRFDAPSYSALAPSKFIARTIRRADKRKIK